MSMLHLIVLVLTPYIFIIIHIIYKHNLIMINYNIIWYMSSTVYIMYLKYSQTVYCISILTWCIKTGAISFFLVTNIQFLQIKKRDFTCMIWPNFFTPVHRKSCCIQINELKSFLYYNIFHLLLLEAWFLNAFNFL